MKELLMTIKQITDLVNESINEQIGDYPPGAENDSNAPWNQGDTPEFDGEFDTFPRLDGQNKV